MLRLNRTVSAAERMRTFQNDNLRSVCILGIIRLDGSFARDRNRMRGTYNETSQTEINGPKRSADERIDLITPGDPIIDTLAFRRIIRHCSIVRSVQLRFV